MHSSVQTNCLGCYEEYPRGFSGRRLPLPKFGEIGTTMNPEMNWRAERSSPFGVHVDGKSGIYY